MFKKLPLKIAITQTAFDGRVAAVLKLHLFVFDISFEFNRKVVDSIPTVELI